MRASDHHTRDRSRQMDHQRIVRLPSGHRLDLQRLTIMFICLSVSTWGRADKVTLVGGSVIEGRITKQSDAGIVLEHEDLGQLEIRSSRIKSIVFDRANAEVVLVGGGTIEGKIIDQNEAGITLEHEDLGEVDIPESRIESMTVDWPDVEIVLVAGDTIKGKMLEQNEVAVVVEHKNLGRLAVPKTQVGLGTRKEWGSENDGYKCEAAEALQFEWDVTSRQKIAASTTVATVVGDLDDYRARSAAEWQFSFERDMALRFVMGIEHEYTSLVDPDDRHSDTRVYIGLRFGI